MSEHTLTKTTRKVAEALNPLGYGYAGKDGKGHVVFTDGDGMVVRIPSTPATDETTVVRRAVATAKKEARRKQTASARFTAWLREHFDVPADGRAEVEFSVTQIVKEFRDAQPEPIKVTDEAFDQALRNDEGIERLRKGSGGSKHITPALWRISGPLFGVTDGAKGIAPASCSVSMTTSGGGLAVCTLAAGHEGEHFDKYRSIRFSTETPDAEEELQLAETTKTAELGPSPLGDEVPTKTEVEDVEGVAETPPPLDEARQVEMVPGLTLPGHLAMALREALAGDVQAEVDLLREALREAHSHVSQALVVLDDAFSIVARAPQPGRRPGRMGLRPKGGPLGTARRERLYQIEAWADEGALPDQFTVHDVMPVVEKAGLPGSASAWSNTLYAGWQNGLLRHVASGLYAAFSKGAE